MRLSAWLSIAAATVTAAVTLSTGCTMDFGQFEDETFSGTMSEPDVPLGFAFAPPEGAVMEEGAAADGPGAAIEFAAGNERITWHSRLLPRHNDVMKNYFRGHAGGEP